VSIGRICEREVDTASAEESVQAAAQRMGTRHVGTLIVVDEQHTPVGVVTDRDIAIRVVAQGRDPHRTSVGEVMSADVLTIPQEIEVEKALTLMRAKTVRRLPVVDEQGHLVGVVSLDDILTLLAREFRELSQLLSEETPDSLRRA